MRGGPVRSERRRMDKDRAGRCTGRPEPCLSRSPIEGHYSIRSQANGAGQANGARLPAPLARVEPARRPKDPARPARARLFGARRRNGCGQPGPEDPALLALGRSQPSGSNAALARWRRGGGASLADGGDAPWPRRGHCADAAIPWRSHPCHYSPRTLHTTRRSSTRTPPTAHAAHRSQRTQQLAARSARHARRSPRTPPAENTACRARRASFKK